MTDEKTPSQPTRLDRPVLKLSPASKADRPRKQSSRPPGKKLCQPAASRSATKRSTSKAGANKDTTALPQSRAIAYDILLAVDDGTQLDKALAAHEGLPKLDVRDRKFVRLLVTTSLRHRGQIEKTIAPMMSRRPFGAQQSANLILLLGAVQILILKTGAHAAVNSTVELMRTAGFERLCGLANAVMRRLSREGEARFQTTSHLDNLPDWLQKSWTFYWGSEAANSMASLAMRPPSLDITVRENPAEWAKRLDATVIDGHSLRRNFDGDPTQLDGFEKGEWWVQDIAAALPARLMKIRPNQKVIDLCAAPGGKTAQLVAAGAKVTAIDQNRKRLDRLRRNMKRLKMQANLVLADGTTFVPDWPVDAVLVDAPCSATGTVRRRPDILASRQPEDIAALQQLQWQLTTHALGWLQPHGRLVYATCSLQPEEGEDMIKAIIDGGDGQYALDPITPEEVGIFAKSCTESGCVRILPSDYQEIGGVDGFFVARIIRLG